MAPNPIHRNQLLLLQSFTSHKHGVPKQTMGLSKRLKPRLFNSTASMNSTSSTADISYLQTELPKRTLPLIYDYLSPQPSHLLNVSLADFLPLSSAQSDSVSAVGSTSSSNHPVLASVTNPPLLPPAHHLIYFPPPVPASQLLPDGTDPLQSPGEPFVRRMWAGGHVRFNTGRSSSSSSSSPSSAPSQSPETNNGPLRLDGHRAVCLEGIRDVTIKGTTAGSEKVFVGIERRIARCGEDESEAAIRARLWPADDAEMGDASIVERRNLVFMRAQTASDAAVAANTAGKIIRAPNTPTFSHTLRPTSSLLFRFSALTFNAHAIHLSRTYTRSIEGHRNMLVHGPLTLVLLTSLLEHHLSSSSSSPLSPSSPKYIITDIQYRNISPLYCDEDVRLCGRESRPGRYELWAENQQGGLAVKGNATVEML